MTTEISLSQGTLNVRDSGSGEPIVFVHGLLTDGSLWRKVTPLLEDEFRCVAPDWPLGSHTEPMAPDADLSPRGVAHLIADAIAEMELEEVTLVGNDTGGAICQLVAVERPERLGRLVLTDCDSFENFLPPLFRPLQWAARVPPLLTAFVQPVRFRSLRRLPIAYGLLSKRPVPHEVTDAWVRPFFSRPEVRRDTAKLLRAIDNRDTLDAASKLASFDRPALVAWTVGSRSFPTEHGRRLASILPQGRFEEVRDSSTYISEDQPERLAELIRDFVRSTPLRSSTPA